MTLKKRRIVMVLCLLLFLTVTPLVLLYAAGYKWDYGFSFHKTGGLYVSSPISGSQIFVNNKLKKETNMLQAGVFVQGLEEDDYLISVSRDGYWPWQKTLPVKEQFVTEARALLVPKNPEGKIILKENYSPLETTSYDEILDELKNIAKSVKSKKIQEKITSSEKEKILWNPKENEVWAQWLGEENSLPYFFCEESSCGDKILVFDSSSPLRNVDFYPQRKDVVIVAVQNGIYAVEIDGRGGRIVQPIYKGREPVFTTRKNDDSIYVFDEENLMEIKLY